MPLGEISPLLHWRSARDNLDKGLLTGYQSLKNMAIWAFLYSVGSSTRSGILSLQSVLSAEYKIPGTRLTTSKCGTRTILDMRSFVTMLLGNHDSMVRHNGCVNLLGMVFCPKAQHGFPRVRVPHALNTSYRISHASSLNSKGYICLYWTPLTPRNWKLNRRRQGYCAW